MLEYCRENVGCRKGLELCTWISFRRLALSSASQGLNARRFFFGEGGVIDISPACQRIRGDFVAACPSMFGRLDSHFDGFLSHFNFGGRAKIETTW